MARRPTMRRLLNITEAKKSPVAAVTGPSPDDLRTLALTLHKRAGTIAQEWRTPSKVWAEQFAGIIRKMHLEWEAQQNEEAEYDDNYSKMPFNISNAAPYALNAWWQGEEYRLAIHDAVKHHITLRP